MEKLNKQIKKPRGLSFVSPERRKEIASKGGLSSVYSSTNHYVFSQKDREKSGKSRKGVKKS